MIKKIFRFISEMLDKDKEEVVREWHSFWIGWGEGVCFSTKHNFPATEMSIEEMKKEWHYYQVGRGFGMLTWALVIISICLIVR